jgi:molybdopterin synthase sulfur carrier subunit
MAVTIRIPTPLRKITGDKAEIPATGRTVKEVLANAGKTYPELLSRILDDAGALRRFVNFYVNEEDIRDLAGADTPVKDGDTLSIMPAIAGGSF